MSVLFHHPEIPCHPCLWFVKVKLWPQLYLLHKCSVKKRNKQKNWTIVWCNASLYHKMVQQVNVTFILPCPHEREEMIMDHGYSSKCEKHMKVNGRCDTHDHQHWLPERNQKKWNRKYCDNNIIFFLKNLLIGQSTFKVSRLLNLVFRRLNWWLLYIQFYVLVTVENKVYFIVPQNSLILYSSCIWNSAETTLMCDHPVLLLKPVIRLPSYCRLV